MDFARAIRTYGDPRNPPIVFLHGIRLGAGIWIEHARLLSDAYYVITPDLPGHGALADLPFEIPVCDALLADTADRVAQRPPLVVGYSLGGYLAMRYAGDLPERTAGLVLTGCSADITGSRELLYEIAVGLAAQFSPAFIERALAVFFRVTLPRRVARTVIPFSFNHRVFASSRKIACAVRYSEILARYGKPVLLINGEWDVPFRLDETLYASRAGARCVVMPHSDHVAPLRRPAEFTAHVRRFAEQVFAGSELLETGPLA